MNEGLWFGPGNLAALSSMIQLIYGGSGVYSAPPTIYSTARLAHTATHSLHFLALLKTYSSTDLDLQPDLSKHPVE
jgi:hypothetical protein